MNATEAVSRTLVEADAFRRQHLDEKEVGRTFGYFTQHPVAPLNRKRLLALLDATQERSGGKPLRVLDVACGGGLITCAIGSLGHRVLGVDISEEELKLARLFSSERQLPGAFLRVDVLEDPSWEAKVEEALGGKPDVITLAYALHHLPGVEKFLERLAKWLDPGSLLLVNEENPESPLFRLKHVVRTWLQNDTEVEWHRSFKGWREMLEQRGFRVKTPVGLDMLPGLGARWSWSLVFGAELRQRS